MTPLDSHTNRHLYKSTKIAAELACRDYLTFYQRPFTVLRLGIPYRPQMRATTVLLSYLRMAPDREPLRIDREGRQVRNFVYVEDLANAYVLASAPAAPNRTFNLDGREPVSIRRLAELMTQLVPGTSVEIGPARPGDLAPRVVVSERAAEVLGWVASVGTEEAVRRSVQWYVANTPAVRADG